MPPKWLPSAPTQTLRCSGHSVIMARTVSRGISSGCPRCCDTFGKPCPPKQPTIYSPRVEVWTPQGPILGADKGHNVHPQPLLSCLGFWAGTESCWKTHSWPLKRVMLSCFTSPCSTSSWYTRTPVSPLAKMKMCHPLLGHLYQTMM